MLRRGDQGPSVQELQARLRELGYWLGSEDGSFGQLTEQAVYALQGVAGLERDGIVGPRTREALDADTRPQARSRSGDLVEIDKSAQVLLVVRDGEVRWAFHTTTGTEQPYEHPDGYTALADTPNGRWDIDWQVNGWRDGDLGPLWRPKYFHRDGLAIHGYERVPPYPASHGCARVTIPAMDFIWGEDLAPKGSTVWIY